ncbi:phBC6A51 family helix-turn-helix protein [Paenilisteria rocourtiae]|uniref:Putative insertion element HTH domain-containing protein n=1 Tax=Listeria rocourtiae TaxID=647910 RepID=A0A4R6ZSC3_9LIST|nr:phBC6A51 family helix-turn-helix protein [Listeria rocourtiae]EUJ44396.1 phage protein [Listeria rocourtiae FSL F6-920]TDR55124.1 putative insertion element HTH domain-containing protein [Listeria rocourtiae]
MATRLETLMDELTEEQQEAIHLLLEQMEYSKKDEDYKSMDAIAEEVGTCRKTLYNWRTKNPVFMEALGLATQARLQTLAPYAYGAMSKLLKGSQPSTKALDLYFKQQGWTNAPQEINITTNSRDDAVLAEEIARLAVQTGVGNNDA